MDAEKRATCSVAWPATILLCVRDRQLRDAIERRLLGRAIVRHVPAAGALCQLCAHLECAGIVYEIDGAGDLRSTGMVKAARWRFSAFPLLLLVPAADIRTGTSSNAVESETIEIAARLEPELIARSCAGELRTVLPRLVHLARHRSAPIRLLATFDRACPQADAVSRGFLAAAATASRNAATAADVADLLRSSLRTVERHLRACRLPPARTLMAWAQLARASFLLQDPRCTLAHITALLPFSDSFAVSHRFRRYAELTPTELRRRGGLDLLLARFERMLRDRDGSGTRRSAPRDESAHDLTHADMVP